MKLKKLLEEIEPNLVVPVNNMTVGSNTTPMEDSVDRKVDRFFIQYEREASPLGQKFGGSVAQPMPMAEIKTKGFFKTVFEADDPLADAGGDAGDDAGGGDLGMDAGGDAGGSEGEESEQLPPQINISMFAEMVSRLVNNLETLVDPKTIVLHRAQTFIAKNYNPKTAQELMSILDKQFGLTARTEKEKVTDFGATPIAVGAGPTGG